MVQRSYGQACPVAFSLDLVGERWTLLIVRDLLLGPLRFVDLLGRLPGIGRNLLAQRLKHLQDEGVVERKKLPPPAASVVYELTDKGLALEPGLMAFGAWGMRFGAGDERFSGHLEPDLMAFAFKLAFEPTRAQGVDQLLEIDVEDRVFHLHVSDGALHAHRGCAEHPTIRVKASGSALARALRSGKLDTKDTRGVSFDGSKAGLRQVLRPFGMDVL